MKAQTVRMRCAKRSVIYLQNVTLNCITYKYAYTENSKAEVSKICVWTEIHSLLTIIQHYQQVQLQVTLKNLFQTGFFFISNIVDAEKFGFQKKYLAAQL